MIINNYTSDFYDELLSAINSWIGLLNMHIAVILSIHERKSDFPMTMKACILGQIKRQNV